MIAMRAEPRTWAGYRAHRRNPLTGAPVVTCEATAQGLDVATRWVTICNEHGTIIGDETLALARFSRLDPGEWCGDCHEAGESRDITAPTGDAR